MKFAFHWMIASYVAVLLFGCDLQEISHYGFIETHSPDGKKIAAWYYSDAGATTRESTALAVFDSTQKREDAASSPVVVIDGTMKPFPAIEWKNNAELVVKLESVKDPILIKTRTAVGVEVKFNTPAGNP